MSASSKPQHRVRLITKPGCHLCSEALDVVGQVTSDLGLGFDEVDAGADQDLMQRFAEEIPVLMVDGVQRDFWRIDPQRLRRILTS